MLFHRTAPQVLPSFYLGIIDIFLYALLQFPFYPRVYCLSHFFCPLSTVRMHPVEGSEHYLLAAERSFRQWIAYPMFPLYVTQVELSSVPHMLEYFLFQELLLF